VVEADLFEIRINELEGEQVVILSERGGDRYLPIVIGICEANAIRPPRPLTHDLLCNIIENLGGEVVRMVISDLSDRTFYAQIIVDVGDEEIAIDARPSDAIALAVRVDCPIFIEEHVLEKNESEGM
jgi:hypothetical protein